MNEVIDLRSDTITRPTPEMRRAMADAEVGDDYYFDDPTVRRLEERAADLLGKEAALLVLSGTMGNLVSILAQVPHGSSAIVEELSHIYVNEAGHLASVCGVTARPVTGHGGFLTPEQVAAAAFPDSVLHPPTRLLCLENTHNAAGGRYLCPERTDVLAAAARQLGLAVHIDGARIFNAAVALGVPAARLAEPVDSVTFCLTKGLGCPVGSLIVGDRDFIGSARHWRQMVGGGMRQAGVFAAAGLVALQSGIDRLAEDHANARLLARLLADCGLPVDPAAVETSMVFVEIPAEFMPANEFVDAIGREGVVINPPKNRRVRFVTHRDVDDRGIRVAAQRIARALEDRPTPTEGR
jgi:threonine aldolase